MHQKDQHRYNQTEYISIQGCSSARLGKGTLSQFLLPGAEETNVIH